MSHDEVLAPKWQLRVLDGPLRGTVHRLRERTSIGRSTSSDLQIIDTGVSRQHAMIVRNQHGEHLLIDLSSVNGTTVRGQPIDRVVLEPHTTFRIADTELVFELDPSPATSGPTESDLVSGELGQTKLRALKSTDELCVLNPQMVGASPQWARVGKVLAGEGHPVIFEGSGGTRHGGLLIDAILEYRRLRAQCLKGGLGNPSQRRHFHALQERLQEPPPPRSVFRRPHRRAFRRFRCWFPATVRLRSGDDLPCWVRDLGVDGAQVVVQVVSQGQPLALDSVAWLALELTVDGRPRAEVLAGRIAWTDGDHLGLAFTGPPRSDNGRYRAGPAVREVMEQTQPIPGAKSLQLVNDRR